MKTNAALGIDLGGSHAGLGLLVNGELAWQARLPVDPRQSFDIIGAALASSVKAVLQQQPFEITSAGCTVPGVVDRQQQVVQIPIGKYEDLVGFDLSQWCRELFGVPAAVDNDARAAAFAEWQVGAGRGVDNLVCVTLGTGIGVAVVCEGRLLRGAHGGAGILGGHLRLHPDAGACICGATGCTEAAASVWKLPELWKTRSGKTGSPPAWTRGYKQLCEAALTDDSARSLREHLLQTWAAAIVDLCSAYDPARVILCGGVAEDAAVHDAVKKAIEQRTWAIGEIDVCAGQLTTQAPLVGAALLGASQRQS